MRKDDYEIVKGNVVPCYSYTEGDDGEMYWIDFQNACYYMESDAGDDGLIEGKKWWIVYPYKLKGSTITEDNMDEVVKWFVSESYDMSGYGLEWDFDNHCPIQEETLSKDIDG